MKIINIWWVTSSAINYLKSDLGKLHKGDWKWSISNIKWLLWNIQCKNFPLIIIPFSFWQILTAIQYQRGFAMKPLVISSLKPICSHEAKVVQQN